MLQENCAKQEHSRLRQLIRALLVYKEDLIIRLPSAAERPACGGRDDEPLGAFRACLEEDPTEAFLSFEEDLGTGPQSADKGQRRIHSAPVQSTGQFLFCAHHTWTFQEISGAYGLSGPFQMNGFQRHL